MIKWQEFQSANPRFFLYPFVCYFVIMFHVKTIVVFYFFWSPVIQVPIFRSLESEMQGIAPCAVTRICVTITVSFFYADISQLCMYSFIQCCTISFKFTIETRFFSQSYQLASDAMQLNSNNYSWALITQSNPWEIKTKTY